MLKHLAIFTILMTVGKPAPAKGPSDRNVIVYLRDNASVPAPVKFRAKALASRMFVGIGIAIEWRQGEPVHSDSSVAVELVTGTSDAIMPGALAYARPYEGVHIRVFYDRIRHQPAATELLGHVLVHEITHILQGVERHSETGVMKAHWTTEEMKSMLDRPLPFAEEDVIRIRLAIVARVSRRGQTKS